MIKVIIFLVSVTCYSQFSFYVPLSTHHFDIDYLWQYADNQGGDKGLVLSYEYKSLITSIGSIRNSYGDVSNVFTIGLIKQIKENDISLSIGIADGYKRYYFFYPDPKYPRVLINNNLVPILLLTTRIKIYNNVGLQFNISPAYINYGFYIKI